MRIGIDRPSGMIPLIEPSKLPINNAILAVNSRFDDGSLSPYGSLVDVPSNLKQNTATIYYYEDMHWFSFTGQVDVVESPINGDQFARVYYTGDGVPKVTSNDIATGSGTMPVLSYHMGVAQPAAPIINAINNNDQNPEGQEDDITTFYVCTYVNGYGEEGMPSEISTEVTRQNPDAEVLLLFGGISTNTQNITSRRIYRIADDAYRLVAELPIASTTYSDTKKDTDLGVVLDTFNFTEPNSQMRGLTLMANGIVAGYFGSTVAFSESYLPHAWPVAYQQTTEERIVGMKAIGNSLVVLTKGKPYLFSGVSPDAISSQKLQLAQSCVSTESIVDMGDYVIYASPDGLVAISEGSASVITEGLFNKKTWQQYVPPTIFAAYYEEKYVGFYNVNRGFIFDPRTKEFVELDFTARALYSDLLTDTLYMVVDNQIKKFDETTSSLTFTWKKLIRLDFKPSPSCAYVDVEDPSLCGFQVEVDGETIVNYPDLSAVGINQQAGESPVFRLPSIRGKECVVTITGTTKVHEIALGSNMGIVQHG